MAITHGMIKVQMMRETMSVFTGSPPRGTYAPFRYRESRVSSDGSNRRLASDLSSRAKNGVAK